MEHTEEQLADFKATLLRQQRWALRALVAGVSAVAVALLYVLFPRPLGEFVGVESPAVWFGVITATMIVATVVSFSMARCPACRCPLGGGQTLRYCSTCGVRLA